MWMFDFLGHVNNVIGLATFGLSCFIAWRLRRIRRAEPEAAGREVLVAFDVQGNITKLSADLRAAGYDAPELLIEASDCLGGPRRPSLDRESEDFEKLTRHFFEKIGPYSASTILLAYNGPAALSLAIGKLSANNYDIVQLHYDNDKNAYQRPPRPNADWRHWTAT